MKKKILFLLFLILSTLLPAEVIETHDVILSDDGKIIGFETTLATANIYLSLEELIESDTVDITTTNSSKEFTYYTYTMPKDLLNFLVPKLTLMLAAPQYELHIPLCLQQLYMDNGFFIDINTYNSDSYVTHYYINITYDTNLYNQFLLLYDEYKDYEKSYNEVIINNEDHVKSNFKNLFSPFFKDDKIEELFNTFFDEYTNN